MPVANVRLLPIYVRSTPETISKTSIRASERRIGLSTAMYYLMRDAERAAIEIEPGNIQEKSEQAGKNR